MTTPFLFYSQKGTLLLQHKNVKAIIEVKTKIRNSNLQEIIEKAKENGKLIVKEAFNGIFSYEYDDNINSSYVDDVLKSTKGHVNHLSLGKDKFIRFWKKEDRNRLSPPVINCEGDFYNIYKLKGLSFSYFISNLLDMACSEKLDDRWWFLFPIEGTKEVHRERTICLE